MQSPLFSVNNSLQHLHYEMADNLSKVMEMKLRKKYVITSAFEASEERSADADNDEKTIKANRNSTTTATTIATTTATTTTTTETELSLEHQRTEMEPEL